MKNLFKICFLLIFFSCNQENRPVTDIINIDPRIFPELKISLAEIANDISYITLDNQFPIGSFFSSKIVNGYIYASIKDIGVVRFNSEGEIDVKYGKIGRGPKEYLYYLSFAVDDISGTVYVLDLKNNDIEVYGKNGNYLRNIKLPVCNEGSGLNEIEFFNASIFIAQYANMCQDQYNWIITDTLGNIISKKKKLSPTFNTVIGSMGGIYKYKKNIKYWDNYNDTIFSISSDLNYKVSHLFAQGEHRLPYHEIKFESPAELLKIIKQFVIAHQLIETKKYLIFRYSFNRQMNIAFINKNSEETSLIYIDEDNRGILNDLDAGMPLDPKTYYVENEDEYLVGIIQPFELKAHVTTEAFKNSTPKYPEKKKELEKLANSLDENDNPVLMLVKLKNE